MERKYVEAIAKAEFKSANRTSDGSLDFPSPLTHSYSSASLPPRPETSLGLRRSKSVVRPASVVMADIDPGKFICNQII